MRTHRARVKNVGDKDSALAVAKLARASRAKRPFVREAETDPGWDLRFTCKYESKSQAEGRRRGRRKLRGRERLRSAASSEDAGWGALFADLKRDERELRGDLIKQRLEEGFVWGGGCFAGSRVYHHDPFRYRGLVSCGHPILRLFVTKVRRAKNLQVGDSKGEIYGVDSKLLALDAAYVEDNKAVCGVLRVEVDALLSWDAVADGCRAAGVPLPNVAVGWTDAQNLVHNPHLIWLLHDSVPLESKGCVRFLSLYRGVLRGLTSALLPMGADPGGLLNSHRHKNPLSPLWDQHIFAQQPYDLSVLAKHVDTTVPLEAVKRAWAARQCAAKHVPDHPDPAVAAGSNKLFAHTAE